MRVFLRGRWRFETADGVREFDAAESNRTIYFGPQTKSMPVEVSGPVRFLLLQFHPGAPPLDQNKTHEEYLDQVECFDSGLPSVIRNATYDDADSRESWLDKFEEFTRQILLSRVNHEPPELALAVYRRLLAKSEIDLAELERDFDISRRTVERQVKASFGISPKQAERRARALDMAAALLGVAMPDEEAEFRLRYFDQSHMSREIHHFFGVSPGVLARQRALLLRIDLEIRQLRRHEALDELGFIEVPWRDPEAEPEAASAPSQTES